ncbi:hypothetical protein EVAR_10718_1 [Eumeta japonica]|uniref:Uncharacterized protein n=1 Tax=Eumeta variegata TaxID=151549 RepID=A0A4C1U7E9_EUMVA|nr:hypothetical protein EVAR_10718_1 [Eumeta japonica]
MFGRDPRRKTGVFFYPCPAFTQFTPLACRRDSRVAGEKKYTCEELSTVFCKFQAVLSSLSLHTLWDPDDLKDPALFTAGHFFNGQPLNAVPEHRYSHMSVSWLSRSKHVYIGPLGKHFVYFEVRPPGRELSRVGGRADSGASTRAPSLLIELSRRMPLMPEHYSIISV